jgi:hypothetical protein
MKVTTVPISNNLFNRNKHLDEEVVFRVKDGIRIRRVRDLKTIELFVVSDNKFVAREIIRRYLYLERLHDKRLRRKRTILRFLKTELNSNELREYRLLHNFLRDQKVLNSVSSRQRWPRNPSIRVQSE